MTRVIRPESNLDMIGLKIIDWIGDSNGGLLIAVDDENETSNPNVDRGFCCYCKKFLENFLSVHKNIYCIKNEYKNEEEVTRYKLREKERLGRKVKCSCGQTIKYSSLFKHRFGKIHGESDCTYEELE